MTTPRWLGWALVPGLLAACALQDESGSSPEAPAPRPLPVAEEAPPFAPPRNRSWPLLERWLGGQDIAREPTAGEPLLPEEELAARGKVLFGMYCYQCHGHDGKGDGPRAPLFDPPPRDLVAGVFKFRSTPTGELPAREDLFATISGGLRGTGMMPFADLPEDHRWALVEYVRALSPRFADDDPGEPLAVPAVPADMDSPARLRAGREAYRELGCGECHGATGRGDGKAAANLKDTLGRPLPPPDLAVRPLKRGSSPAATFLSVATGLDGTPMPAYGESAPAESLWNVVAYVRELKAQGEQALSDRDRAEAAELLGVQARQGQHAVVGGCGCQAGRKQR